MDNQQTQKTEENKEPKLKTWDEAIRELGSFIRQSKAEEAKNKQEEKEE